MVAKIVDGTPANVPAESHYKVVVAFRSTFPIPQAKRNQIQMPHHLKRSKESGCMMGNNKSLAHRNFAGNLWDTGVEGHWKKNICSGDGLQNICLGIVRPWSKKLKWTLIYSTMLYSIEFQMLIIWGEDSLKLLCKIALFFPFFGRNNALILS